MKRRRRKIKNFVIKTISIIAFITFFISACCLDSDNIKIPLILMGISGTWLFLFIKANEEGN